jgi:Ankyrin repeats (many copies)
VKSADDFLGAARAIARREPRVAALLGASPALAREAVRVGATRASPSPWFLDEIKHYIYEGDTLLHVAAATYDLDVARTLVAAGADVRARNRRGAEPLHYAADGGPGPRWDPPAQAAIVTYLIEAGAEPDALDKSGVAPLHRAVRTRCTGAVRTLLAGGADPRLPNKSGSTPMDLALGTTGRGGSGSPEAKREQAEIVRLLSSQGAEGRRPRR